MRTRWPRPTFVGPVSGPAAAVVGIFCLASTLLACADEADDGAVHSGRAVQGCTAGELAACDDGNACTQDVCESGGGCTHTKITGPCQLGQPCTVGLCKADTCTASGAASYTIEIEDLLPWDLRARPGGGLVAVGGKDTGLQWKPRIVAIDAWGKTVPDESLVIDATTRRCAFRSDGGLICAGPGGPANVPLRQQHPHLQGWDSAGTSLWKTTLASWPSDERGCRQLAIASDDGAFCGLDDPPGGPHQPLARLQANGQQAWGRVIKEIALHEPPPLAAVADGGVVMAGLPPSDAAAGIYKAVRILRLKPTGEAAWSTDVAAPAAGKGVEFLAMATAADQGVVVAVSDRIGCDGADCGSCSPACDRVQAWLTAVGPTGQLKWVRAVPMTDNRSWHDWLHVAPMPSGGAALLGRPAPMSGKRWGSAECANWIARAGPLGELSAAAAPLSVCQEPATLLMGGATGVAALGWWVFSDAKKSSQRATIVRTTAWGHGDCKSAGKCATLTPVDCDDGDACTVDDCRPDVGCVHEALADGVECGGGAGSGP